MALDFATDLEAAKHFINMNIIEDVPNSTRQFTLVCTPGDIHIGNRGAESVMSIGEAISQLRNEAGLNPGQVAVSRADDRVTIQTTMDNWNKLRAHVKPVERAAATSAR